MNFLDKQYQELLFEITTRGVDKETRNGKTRSLFGKQIRHDMRLGFPLLTTKKMAWKQIVTELLWFLRGDTNIKYLVDNNCHIWDGDAYRNYEILMIGNPPEKTLDKDEFIQKIKEDAEIEHSPFTFAKKWGELGPIYGAQWRDWGSMYDINYILGTKTKRKPGIDQIKNLIKDLKTNPDSRRLMVNAWNVGELDSMTLPPCHYGFQVYTRELTYNERYDIWFKKNYETGMEHNYNLKPNFDDSYYEPTPERYISLMWNQRSVDTFLGLPFNIASYGLLLEIIAKCVNMVPYELIGNLGDTHLYLNHMSQVSEQIKREPYKLPIVVHQKTDEFYKSLSEDLSLISHLDISDFVLQNYQSHPTIKAPLSN